MNQGRIWTVVSPNHGLPILIGSVALTSLIVHYSVLSHVTWMGNYWNGGVKRTAMSSDAPTVGQANGAAAFTVSVSPVVGDAGKTSFVVSVTPKGAADATVTVGDASPAKAN
jgi:light-harvesting protein B-800-850 alpha chain